MSTRIQKLIDNFKIFEEKEDYEAVMDVIQKGIFFRGTNLWVLIFAIFIASLGLNVNSTAVIIGAMLISPLMGPIMGIGMGLAINDFSLLNTAFRNYLFAAVVGLTTSTLYFSITPLNEAHSELLARTSPNFYDVLIAFFGGLAGIIATSSKMKGNVVPGVAIATALMPPLCTAGYGIATTQWTFMLGALYLFFINTVFIALATFLTARILKFPLLHLPDPVKDRWAQRIVTFVVLLTVLPSVYLGYEMIQKERFVRNATRFIEMEAGIEGDYLLSKRVDPKRKKIELIYGGNPISEFQRQRMTERMKYYNLGNASLHVQLGFALANESEDRNRLLNLVEELNKKEAALSQMESQLDSIQSQSLLANQILNELQVQYSALQEAYITPIPRKDVKDSTTTISNLVILDFSSKPGDADLKKIRDWLKVRLRDDRVRLIIE
jgi:uncharacterized hydrophobic protein (TIGR00271 family)